MVSRTWQSIFSPKAGYARKSSVTNHSFQSGTHLSTNTRISRSSVLIETNIKRFSKSIPIYPIIWSSLTWTIFTRLPFLPRNTRTAEFSRTASVSHFSCLDKVWGSCDIQKCKFCKNDLRPKTVLNVYF
jgi:hypothetical protein